MIDRDCGNPSEARALMAQDAALHLFQLAALMVGQERDAVSVVEETVASVQADPCADSAAAQDEALARLVSAAIRHTDRLHPGAFTAPQEEEGEASCIDPDDVSATGFSTQQIAVMVNAPERARLREWLERLAPAPRLIFVLRAVMGQDAEQAAASLRGSGTPGTESWQKATVGSAYRQALCSLATSLLATSAIPA